MPGRRFFCIVSIATLLGAVAACSEVKTGPGANTQLGSKKPIKVGDRRQRIGSADPDLALLTGAEPPKGAKVDGATMARLGDTAMGRGQYTVAATFYGRAVRLEPRTIAFRRKLGFALFRARRLDQARVVFTSAAKEAPRDPAILRGLANTLVAQGDPAAAIPVYRRALKASTGRFADYRIYNGLGVALDLSGRHRAAQRTYRLGLAQSPGNGSLRNNYALSLAAAGKYAEAVRMLAKLVRENRGSAKYRRNLERVKVRAAKAGVSVSAAPGLDSSRQPRRAARPPEAAPTRTAVRDAPHQTASRQKAKRGSKPSSARRTAGAPIRLLPRTLPDVRKLAARPGPQPGPNSRPGATPGIEDEPRADAPPRSVAEAPPVDRKPEPDPAPAGVTAPAERELLSRLGTRPRGDETSPPATRPAPRKPSSLPTPSRTPVQTPGRVLQADAATLNRLAPAAGNPPKPAFRRDPDDLDEAEKADRLFLRALGGRPARK